MDFTEDTTRQGKRLGEDVTSHSTAKKVKESICLVNTSKPNLKLLKEAYGLFSFREKHDFEVQFGCIGDLLLVVLDWNLFRAMLKFCVPQYQAFVFPHFELVPTIDEYRHFLRCSPIVDSSTFTPQAQHMKFTLEKIQEMLQAMGPQFEALFSILVKDKKTEDWHQSLLAATINDVGFVLPTWNVTHYLAPLEGHHSIPLLGIHGNVTYSVELASLKLSLPWEVTNMKNSTIMDLTAKLELSHAQRCRLLEKYDELALDHELLKRGKELSDQQVAGLKDKIASLERDLATSKEICGKQKRSLEFAEEQPPRRKVFKKQRSLYLLKSRVTKMFEENAATNLVKSIVDEKVDKLEAIMQTIAVTFQTISLTLSTLTTGSVPSPASLIPTILVPLVPTITPGNHAKDLMVTQLQFPPIYENQPLARESSSHAPQISSLSFEASYPPFEMNNPTLPTTTPLTLNIPPLMGQVPTIQPNLSVAMLRLALEDGKSRKIDHKLQQLEEALKAMQGPQTYVNYGTFHAWLAPCVGYTFAQLMTTGEQIKEGQKAGVIMNFQTIQRQLEQVKMGISGSTLKRFSHKRKKKDEEALNHIFTSHVKPINAPYNRQPQLQHTPIFKFTTYPQRRPNFDALAPTVQANHVQPPYPYGYDPQAKCEYHNVTGHGIEYCTTLKHKIQDLINEGKLQLDETKSAPSITQNPLPPHGAPTMNMITLDEVDRLILENTGSWSLDELFAILIEYDLIQLIASMNSNVPPITIDDALFMFAPKSEKFKAPVTEEYFTKERPYILQDTKRAPAISQNFQQPYILKTSLSESFMGKTSFVANSCLPYSLKVMPQRPVILNSTTNDVSTMNRSG
ncbi:hypothetical protein SLEP1_g42475 [Rubroshorea leprosula]|uniref:DUF7745 domain-containing protein n=1 Tax=Rubroshorea leprosula TaxID=152421 RepID=A0AAV5LA65_9ROSI|nr:hypothetical protein SLEP1_g42475 [Rubroshorea leprosula]